MRPSRRQIQPFVRRWPAGRPSVTALAVALSIGAYGAQLIVETLLADQPTRHIFRQWLALDPQAVVLGQWWRFLTFGLLHGSLPYVVGNLLLLYFAGREVEPIVGPRHFLGIYGLGNLLGGLAHWSAGHWSAIPSSTLMGVSAGVAAVVVAFTTILPELEVTTNLFFLIPLRLHAKHLAYALVGVCALCWWTITGTDLAHVDFSPVAILTGSLFGWAYVKQLGFGNPLPVQRYIFDRRQRAARLDRMSAEQFLAVEMDPILEKIAQHGMKSLTRAEKKILEQGRGKLHARTSQKS